MFIKPIIKFALVVLSFLALASCTEAVNHDRNPQILTMGDSLLSTNTLTGQSVSHQVEKSLNQEVVDRSVPGARMAYNLPISGSLGLNISKQYVKGDWDWVILNGGGNDLLFGCGCGACARKMNKLISWDGERGKIPDLIGHLRQSGAKVIYVGYLRTPGFSSIIERCSDEGDELDRRIELAATQDDGLYFLSNADLVPHGDKSYHTADTIHPSPKASKSIGQRIARIISES